MKKFIFASPLAIMSAWATVAMAEAGLDVGKPTAGAIGLQPAVGEVALRTEALNHGLIWLSIAISLFVTVLLVIVVVRFRDTGKEPKRFSHNTPLEIAWTLIPVLILVVLAFFSVPALKAQLDHPEGEVVVRATGYQWYWSYEYPEEGVSFDSYMLQRDQLAEYGYEDDMYLLAVDNAVVVPENTDVIVEIQGADVIHAWKIPAFAVMADAVPGRTQVQHFNVPAGTYFGQCSELCGKLHAYMPIEVRVVTQDEYQTWLEKQKSGSASVAVPMTVASK